MEGLQATTTTRAKKRKAEGQDNNDRLSKRLSLLNLERNGQMLYVPVEQPTSPPPRKAPKAAQNEDFMEVENSKHKVYIYDLDAELSDSESDDGKLVFLPDIEKHLRETRIPPSVLANSDGELAGCSQLVLYNIPSSLTVPEEKDSVRKAIIETRARARAKQEEENRIAVSRVARTSAPSIVNGNVDTPSWYNSVANGTAAASNGLEPTANDPDAMDLG